MESDEFRTAVAAAAFAIGSVEERRRTRRRRDDSLSKGKSKTDDGAVSVTRRARERISSSSSSSNNKMKNKDDNTVHMSTPSLLPKKSSGTRILNWIIITKVLAFFLFLYTAEYKWFRKSKGWRFNVLCSSVLNFRSTESQEKVSDKANRPSNTDFTSEAFSSSPFVKKTSDSFQKQSDKRKPETGLESSRREQPTEQLTFPATEVDRKRSQPTLEDVKADAWEKNEMERIKERYMSYF